MWLLFLKDHWKTFAVLFALVFCGGFGYYKGRQSAAGQVRVEIQEKIVEKEKIVTVEVEKKKTNKETKKVTKPDGTIEETTKETTESETTANTTKESSKTSETKTKTATAQDKYRLGVFAARDIPGLLKDPLKKPDWGLQAGVRVFGPAWADASYNFSNKEMSLGLSVQF